MPQTTAGHVFMSYSRRDEAVMRRIVMHLRGQAINVWVDHEKLKPGTAVWEAKIEKALTGASAVIVILSPDSRNSKWVRREISFAEQYEKPIFPVLVRGDEDTSIPIRLITTQFVDLRQNEEAGLASLSRAIISYLDDLTGREVKTQEEGQQLATLHVIKEQPPREPAGAQPEPAREPVERSKPGKSPWRTIGIAGAVVAVLAVCICGGITFLPGLLEPSATNAPVVVKTEIKMTPAIAPITPPQEVLPTPTEGPFTEPAQTYTVRILDGQSYHFLSGSYGEVGEGDFYYLFQGKDYFWANNMNQMGIVDLGDIGDVPLDQIVQPLNDHDYQRSQIEVLVGHTYVSRANADEPNCYITFRVLELMSGEYVDVEYYYWWP